jgi:hypothetical protein
MVGTARPTLLEDREPQAATIQPLESVLNVDDGDARIERRLSNMVLARMLADQKIWEAADLGGNRERLCNPA